MKKPSALLSCSIAGLLLADGAVAQGNSSAAAWISPFPVEPCNGINIKDITVAELQQVRGQDPDLSKAVRVLTGSSISATAALRLFS